MFRSNYVDFRGGMFKWIILFVVLDLALRGFALWRSARRTEKWWFLALLLVNSLGILPTIYLLTHKEMVTSAKKKK